MSRGFFYLYAICGKKEGVSAIYGHVQAVNAFSRITRESGEQIINNQMSSFVREIYKNYCMRNEKYFLDKTPRYYWILEDLMQVFPDAKFIVLLRNPISIFSSSIEAFRGNSMRRLDSLKNDFIYGPDRIAQFVDKYPNTIKVLNYELLVKDTKTVISEILEYLELDFFDTIIEDSFNIEIQGHGDHLGARKFKQVVNNYSKWKNIICTTYRKRQLIKYLKNYPQNYLKIGGFNRENLLNEVYNHKTNKVNIVEYFYYIEELFASAYKIIGKRYYG